MRHARRILAALVMWAVAIAPAAGAMAAAAKMGSAPAMADCHKGASGNSAAPAKVPSHCPDCDKSGTCGEACLAKCSATTPAVVGSVARAAMLEVEPFADIGADRPPSRSLAPPAPPPRA